MNWTTEYLPEAIRDLNERNNPVKSEVVKGIRKVSQNPGYPNGYGKPLGNHEGSNMAGLYKIKFKKAGLRVVYGLKPEGEIMKVIIISARADNAVYFEAEKRRNKYNI